MEDVVIELFNAAALDGECGEGWMCRWWRSGCILKTQPIILIQDSDERSATPRLSSAAVRMFACNC